jgi:hypothetical protein
VHIGAGQIGNDAFPPSGAIRGPSRSSTALAPRKRRGSPASRRSRSAVADRSRAESEARATAEAAKAIATTATESVATARDVAIAERERQITVIAAKREAERDATKITVIAAAERSAAQDRAAAVLTEAQAAADAAKIKAEATQRTYEAEAEGQRRINEARNTMSAAIIDFDIAKERLRTIPQALSETVRPLEKIGDIRIIDLGGGLPGRIGIGNGIGNGPVGGPMDGLLGSLLAYRANAPVVDKLLAEAGFNGGSNPLEALVSAASSPPPPAHAVDGSGAPAKSASEIHATLKKWTDALANGRGETPVIELYDKDATVLATFDPKPLETPRDIASYFHKLTQNPDLKATVQSEKIDLFGDAAVASGLYTFSYTKDGQPLQLPARYTFVYRKTPHGWMIVRHHSSALPELITNV